MNESRSYTFGFINLNRDLLLLGAFVFTCGNGLTSFSDVGRGPSQALSDSGNFLNQAIWIVVFVNSALLALLGGVKRLQFLRAIIWLLPLMIWIISSTWWSAYPEITIRRAGREEIELISIMLLSCMYSRPSELLRIILLSFLTILLLDLASLLYPSVSYKSSAGFNGIHGHKNVLGEFYFLALPLFIFGIFDRAILWARLIAVFASIAGATFLLLSGSKTSIGLFITTSFGVLAVRAARAFRRYLAVIVVIYFLIIVIAVLLVLTNGIEETLSVLTGNPTLTGRVNVWRYVLFRWLESPYLGQGYGALWQVGGQVSEYLRDAQVNWIMNEAHNGYLDMLAQIGIIGLVLLGFFLVAAISTIVFAKERGRNGWSAWRYYSIYVALGVPLFNITESTLARAGFLGWILFVAVFAAAGLSEQYSIVEKVYPNDKLISGRLRHQRT